jgi:hypothetical protein
MKEPFVEKNISKKVGFNIGVILNSKNPVKGKVGIEIEVEGNKFPKPPGCDGSHTKVPMPGLNYWSYVHDGSLRGKDNAEYVLSKPIEFGEADKALKQLFTALNEYGSVIDESNRTSVHVHLNCQEFHLNRLATFMALWFTFEEILTQWCGEHRVGNLFCLRSRDATAIISHLRKFLKSDGKYELSDHLHYAGLNANALRKFGSLEIRTMRGVNNPDVIRDWIEILQRLYEYSASIPDPRDVCGLFSGQGPLQMFYTVLGDKALTVRSGLDWDDNQVRDSMFTGIRLAQDLCYCRDWDLYKPQELKPDPFNRDTKKIAKKLTSIDIETQGIYFEPGPSPSDLYPMQEQQPTSLSQLNSAWAQVLNNGPGVYTGHTIHFGN